MTESAADGAGRSASSASTAIGELKDLGNQAARRHENEISQQFLFAPAEPFRPYHAIERAALPAG